MPKGVYVRVKGRPRTDREKASLAAIQALRIGTHHTPEAKEKISLTKTGKKMPEGYGESVSKRVSGEGNPMFGKKHKEETLDKMSKNLKGKVAWNKGLPASDEERARLGSLRVGIKHTPETKEKMSGEAHPWYGKFGEFHPAWKGGINVLANTIRNSTEYKKWRTAVFLRDGFTCVLCRVKDGRLEAHHCIIRFSDMLRQYKITSTLEAFNCRELWDTRLGETLCVDCHDYFHRHPREYGDGA